MKRTGKFVAALSAAVLVAGTGIGVYAAELATPAEKLSELTGQSVESLYEAKGDSTFGAIAAEEGVLDEFKADMLARKQAVLEQRVEEGRLTQEEADTIRERLEENLATCDGTGLNRGEERLGIGFGKGGGMGAGNRFGDGQGQGGGRGAGNGPGQGMRFGQGL
ncbi:hypothetical protein [Anaerotalea alkaliphila]|uniref:DUF2680 domain-containing protein n=1 Tax=Anaerotalea alkaliphila TaxID=2662126 RepID=A0A7X5KLF3_9FIRM|nr:hypothetical protein [Anaerotalea alkaliphila]NDL66649.1 hypothetical protein [Anaerotalea alkaliphila]